MAAKREKIGFSDDETYDIIMNELGWLAGAWRGTKSDEYVKKYQAL